MGRCQKSGARAALATVLVIGVACGGQARNGDGQRNVANTPVAPNDSASGDSPIEFPLLELPLYLDEGAWRAADSRGKVLVVDVWATWCEPCRKGFPYLNELAVELPEVSFVAISVDDDTGPIEGFVADTPIGFPVAHDAAKQVTKPPLGLTAVPVVMLVDRDGKVVERIDSPTADDYPAFANRVRALVAR